VAGELAGTERVKSREKEKARVKRGRHRRKAAWELMEPKKRSGNLERENGGEEKRSAKKHLRPRSHAAGMGATSKLGGACKRKGRGAVRKFAFKRRVEKKKEVERERGTKKHRNWADDVLKKVR